VTLGLSHGQGGLGGGFCLKSEISFLLARGQQGLVLLQKEAKAVLFVFC
jgi:hypothetical protein